MFNAYKLVDGKKMFCGYTTGSCATAAAKAASVGLITGVIPNAVNIITPNETKLEIEILEKNDATCAVKKFSGDDPDVTSGMLIYASAEKIVEKTVQVEGGLGIGRVTKKGLQTPVGSAAINPTPLKMIQEEVRKLIDEYDLDYGIKITVFAPEGEKIAKKTYNGRLGIVGGISILGTSGIVEPMSTQAMIETTNIQLRQCKANGYNNIVLTPGNYGKAFIDTATEIKSEQVVVCSNYIGDALDNAKDIGFEKVLLIGHIGKFIKLSGGVYNTHSNNCDIRMELFVSAAIRAGADIKIARQLLDCMTTEDAIDVLKGADLCEKTMAYVMEKIAYHVQKRYDKQIGILMFSTKHALLAQSKQAKDILKGWF